jgi:hypothetical protein
MAGPRARLAPPGYDHELTVTHQRALKGRDSMPDTDPNQVRLTGENSFIRLLDAPDAPN